MAAAAIHPGNLRAKRESRVSDPGFEPVPPTILGSYAYDAGSRHVPLAILRPGECRFPVNNAAPGELHLFCGFDAGSGGYCAHHTARAFNGLTAAYAVRRELEKRATRAG